MGNRIAIAAGAAGIAASLFAAPAAQASVTLGSDLSPAPNATIGGANVSLLQTALPGARLTSPVNGLIVSWRAIVATPTSSAGVRVVRPLGGSRLFLSEASPVGVAEGGTAISASIPISIGDTVALDLEGTLRLLTPATGAVYDSWAPHPSGGIAPPPPGPPTTDRELYYNAEIQPTNTFTLGTPVADKKKGAATIDISLPNIGSVHGAPVTATRSERTMIKKKKKKKKKPAPLIAPFTAVSVGPGSLTLTLKPTAATLKRMRRTGKASGFVDFTYTPDFGLQSTQTTGLTLRLTKPKKKAAKTFTVG